MTQEEGQKLPEIDFTSPEVMRMAKIVAKKMVADIEHDASESPETRWSFFKVVGQTRERKVIDHALLLGRTLREIKLMLKDEPGHYTCYGFETNPATNKIISIVKHIKIS